VGSLIGLFITEGYNFIKSQINPQAIHIPEVIPFVFGIVGISLLVYILIQNRRNREGRIIDKIKGQQKQEELEKNREEVRQLEEGESSDPKRQRENRDRYTPTGFK